jgi:hypothetical protein
MEEFEKSLTNITPEKNPDLIMDIKATPEQMADFGIEIQGSKIIRKGKPGKVEGNTGTFPVEDAIFDFSKKESKQDPKIYQPRTFDLGGTGTITFGMPSNTKLPNLYDFPDATYVSLKYFTPETKPRTNVPGEYRAGDYFELKVTNKDGSKNTFYLESNLDLLNR